MKEKSLSLSIVILTHRNDERFLRALASAQPAKEVLIVDFDSDNNWQQLKKQFHFRKISRTKAISHFAKERNEALKKAKHDWVFFLDSDEVINSASWPIIEKAIADDRLDGVMVRRRDVFYGRPLRFGETGHAWLLRLMKKNAAAFSRPVHETARVKGVVRQKNILLHHFSHTSIQEFFTTISQYAAIEAEYQSDRKLPAMLLGIKTIAYPTAKFLQNFLFRLGFLDGWRGLIYAVMMSFHSIFVRVFSYENR